MHSFLLNLMLGVFAKAEELVLGAAGTTEKVLTQDIKLFGSDFELDVTVRKK